MNRKLIIRLGGLLVSIALFGLIVPVVASWLGMGSAPKTQRTAPAEAGSMEPQFQDEARGAVVDQDTVVEFRLELAESTAETTQGMMYRRSVPEGTGMLFIMPEERYQSFWMRNTYVPLDIIYINEAGIVVSIQANAQPLNETPLPSEAPAKLVLEIAGGQAEALGIKPGMKWLWTRNNEF